MTKTACHHSGLSQFLASTLTMLTLVGLIILAASCTDVWGTLDNPADPTGSNYQGYETQKDPDAIKPVEVDAGVVTYVPVFRAEKVAGATAYQFQVAADNSFATVLWESPETESNEFTPGGLGGLSATTSYYWRVRALVNGIPGEWSKSIATFCLRMMESDNIVPPNTGTTIDTMPLLDWNDVTGASSYDLQYARTSSDVVESLVIVSSNSEYKVSNRLDLGTWYWRVRPKDENNVYGAWSSIWSFVVIWPYTIIPNPPNAGITPDTTPLLDWNDVTSASGYAVQYADSSEGVEGSPIITIANSEYQHPTTLALGDTIYWRIRAKNVDNEWGEWSSTWRFIVSWIYAIVPNPTNAGTTSNKLPLLDWDDVTGASSYDLQYANTSSGLIESPGIVVPDSQYQYPTTLMVGDTVYWRVRVKNEDNIWGAWSSVWNFSVAYAIGDIGPAGGKVFYDKGSYSDNWRYLEAWTADEPGTYQWKTSNTSTAGTSFTIGTGYTNTYTVMAGTEHEAAEACRNATHGGKTDWFLPSIDELAQMHTQRNVIGGFAPDRYWSSSESQSEISSYQACYLYFVDGGYYATYKNSHYLVRAVRAF